MPQRINVYNTMSGDKRNYDRALQKSRRSSRLVRDEVRLENGRQDLSQSIRPRKNTSPLATDDWQDLDLRSTDHASHANRSAKPTIWSPPLQQVLRDRSSIQLLVTFVVGYSWTWSSCSVYFPHPPCKAPTISRLTEQTTHGSNNTLPWLPALEDL